MRLSTMAGFSASYRLPAPDDALRTQPGLLQQAGRIRGKRIAQTRDVPLSVTALRTGHDDARLAAQLLDVRVDAVVLQRPLRDPGASEHQKRERKSPEPWREPRVGWLLLPLEAGVQPRGQIAQVRAVAVERLEWTAQGLVNAGERIAKRSVQCLGRIAPDHGGQQGERPLLAPEQEVAESQTVDAGVSARWIAAEGVAHEVLNGREHARHHVRILRVRLRCRHVFEEEARLTVDEKEMFDAEDDCVLEHDVGIRAAAAERFQTPFQSAPREAVLEGLIQPAKGTVERLGNRLANQRTDERIQNTDQRPGVLANRPTGGVLHGGRENRRETIVPCLGQRQRLRQDGADGLGELLRIVDLLTEGFKGGPIVLQQHTSQRIELRIAAEPAGKRSGQILVDASSHFQQQVGKPTGCLRIGRGRRTADGEGQSGHQRVPGRPTDG